MSKIIRLVTYWLFQAVNTLTGLGLFLAPKNFHEGMFENQEQAYALLGFSATALDMLHNVLRGQGAALLAISLFLFYLRARDRRSFLLISLACGLTLVAHGFTLQQHLASGAVQAAISSFGALYGMIALNALLLLGALWTFIRLPARP